jgi:uncharacterized protein (TIGR03792 family)
MSGFNAADLRANCPNLSWFQGMGLKRVWLYLQRLQGQWPEGDCPEGMLRKSIWLQRWPKSCLALALLVATLVISAVPGRAEAAPPPPLVVEQLRLKVPSDAVPAWLEAERGSWEPWLAQQPGFMRRQLFWDPQRQEGTLMIYWASRQQWQATSSEEQHQVQQRFELLARAGTGQEQGNPFPLIFSGELLPQ